jgi:hypothetical protein
MDAERQKNIIEIWKTVVDVQKHFNDIEMKIRGLFITIVLAIAAAEGFLIDKSLSFQVGGAKILYANFIPLLGVAGTYLFYFMDKHWYHRLLVGSVLHGIFIEKKYEKELPELSLSAKIGDESPVLLKNWFGRILAYFFVSKEHYKGNKIRSDGKIELFYKSVLFLFILMFIGTALFGGVIVSERSLAGILCAKLTNLCS